MKKIVPLPGAARFSTCDAQASAAVRTPHAVKPGALQVDSNEFAKAMEDGREMYLMPNGDIRFGAPDRLSTLDTPEEVRTITSIKQGELAAPGLFGRFGRAVRDFLLEPSDRFNPYATQFGAAADEATRRACENFGMAGMARAIDATVVMPAGAGGYEPPNRSAMATRVLNAKRENAPVNSPSVVTKVVPARGDSPLKPAAAAPVLASAPVPACAAAALEQALAPERLAVADRPAPGNAATAAMMAAALAAAAPAGLARANQAETAPDGPLVFGSCSTLDEEDAVVTPLAIRSGELAASTRQVARQWYHRYPQLLDMEKAAMKRSFPSAEFCILEDGAAAWAVPLRITVDGESHNHVLLAVYLRDHPINQSNYYGATVRIYSTYPSIDKLEEQAEERGREGFTHVLTDENGSKYLCTARRKDSGDEADEFVSAATCVAWAAKWLYAYHAGLNNAEAWAQFIAHK